MTDFDWNAPPDPAACAAPSAPPAARALWESLEPLDQARPGLAPRALAYVVAGLHPEVLLELGQLAEAWYWLGQPGSTHTSQPGDDPQRLQAGRRCYAARARFLAAASEAVVPAGVQARLGRLLLASNRQQPLEPVLQAPEWLAMLVHEGLVRQPQDGFHRLAQVDGSAPGRWPLTVALLEQLLLSEGESAARALPIVFDRAQAQDWLVRRLRPLLELADLEARLLADPPSTRALPGVLGAQGRAQLVEVLARPALAAAFPDLLVRLAVDPARSVRELAVPRLEALDAAGRLRLLDELLRGAADSALRVQAADLLGRQPDGAGIPLLQAALANEVRKPVQQAIRAALERQAAAVSAQAGELPEPAPLAELEETPLGEEIVQLLLASKAELEAPAKHPGGEENWIVRELRKVDEDQVRAAVDWLNGAPRRHRNELRHVLDHQQKLARHPRLQLLHVVRLMELHGRGEFAGNSGFEAWLQLQPGRQVDLRRLAQACSRLHLPLRKVALFALGYSWREKSRPQDLFEAPLVWPFFAEHPEFLDEALGLVPPATTQGYEQFELQHGLGVLQTFPAVPARFVPKLLELALGSGRTHREAAQAVLRKLPDLASRIAGTLEAGKGELRMVAAEWLADLGAREAVPALRAALEKEKNEAVRAALLGALERLGVDLAPWLSPAVLLDEAVRGLKAKPPAGLAWFDFEALPALQWADGSAVDPRVPRWWIVLATKLKEPAGNPLLQRWLGALAPASRAALGRSILSQFIAHDTRRPSLEQATAVAESQADLRFANYQQWSKQMPELADITRESLVEQVRREQLAIYLGSAIGEKGLLALIGGLPGHELAATVQQFMRDHHVRRGQIEALLHALSASSEPAALQLVIGTARRHRTASVQATARQLVDQIARRQGWSAEQLADRTMPSAGFDESGSQVLDYGERQFTLRLDAALKPALSDAEGKPLKALPEPRKSESAELAAAAKAQFNACRKELKQVLEQQQARLYEAMCAQRRWPAAEWQEFLLGHPIVNRLLQRLLWVEHAADGSQRLFRPGDDLALLDVEDEVVELAPEAQVGLAHGALLAPAQAAAWTRHLKDYKVAPLFAQLGRAAAPAAATGQQESTARQGWCGDTFGFRGAFGKLGWQRGPAEDGGCFFHYHKDFASAGVRATIAFSGSSLPETQRPAVLRELYFERLGGRGNGQRLPLAEVPAVLHAEAHADYCQVAASGAGYKADWEQVSAW